MAVTWHIDSNSTVSVLWVLGRVPMFTFDMNMKSFIFADSGVISLVHLFVSISVIKPIIDVQRKPSWYGSDVDMNIFSALRSLPYGTIDIILKRCIWTVTNCDTIVAICDLSQFVIMAVTWHIDSNNTVSVLWVLGRVPIFTFDMNIKSFIFADSGVISLVHLFVSISVIKPIIDVQRKPSWEGPMLMWTSFLQLGVYLTAQLTSIWKVVFWTVTNCDSHKLRHYRRNLWFVAICDQSRDGANWVQQHWKRVLCTWQSTHVHFWHEYENLHFYPFWCYFTGTFVLMYITYKAHNRCTKETFLIGSDVDVNIFSAFRSIPSGKIDLNPKSCILNRHKLRQSQIATLPSQFVICRNLWSKPWRCKLSPITLKTCSVYLGEYPCSLLTWIWELTFLPILVLFHWYIWLCVCISVIKPIIDVQSKPSW